MRKFIPFTAAAVAALVLAGCSDPGQEKADVTEPESGAVETEGFDPATIEPVEDIVAMTPDTLVTPDQLTNGASTDYPPGEFLMDDGKTPTGYDIEIVEGLARVMGLEKGVTQHAEFPAIIPSLGTKFDVGASSFTITPERLEQVNMVSYLEVGSAYAVKEGNPTGFNPEDVCGTTIGVQTGTYQEEYALELSAACVADGKDEVQVMPHQLQSDVVTKVSGGQYDATLADSPVIGFAVASSDGKLEQVGEVIEAEPQGIAISKHDDQLTAAVQAAMQHLMDEGYLAKILANYGAEDSALSQANINPES